MRLTDGEYRAELQLLSTEIEDAIIIHYTYEEINRLAVSNKAVREALSGDVLFWKTQMYCLQTSLFMTLSRIFDNDKSGEASTIHKLISGALANVQLFSASALSR